MTENQWKSFCKFKVKFKNLCDLWAQNHDELFLLQQQVMGTDADYNIETPVVYNTDYDKITREDEINLIVIGDNPGKEEQLLKNQRYLCGQSGRLADGFFKRNPELKTDFRKNVIIMNKTPVHTAKTTQLKDMIKKGSARIKQLIEESQKEMAKLAAGLHKELVEFSAQGKMKPELWLVGYSELKPKKIFELYRDTLKAEYSQNKKAWNKVFVYQHFSMNRFLLDLREFIKNNPELSLKENLENLGHLHRNEIFE